MPIHITIQNDDHFRAALFAMLGGNVVPLAPENVKAKAPTNLEVVVLNLDFRHSPRNGIEGRFRLEGTWPVFSDDSSPPEMNTLTHREEEVLRALSRGLSYKMAADSLSISIGTVRSHVCKIYKKLRVHSVTEAVAKAFLK